MIRVEENGFVNNNDEKSLFRHEQVAIDDIRKKIAHGNIGQCISNVLLYDNQTRNYYEYDLIVFTCANIYVVELKHWSGNISIQPYHWIINNTQYRSDPHKNNSFKCKILKGFYQHKFRSYPDIWVESVVVLTNPEANIENYDNPKDAVEKNIKNPTFYSIDDFISYIRKKEGRDKKKLDKDKVHLIVNYISSLNQPKRNIKMQIPGYETIEYISQKEECIELLARPLTPYAKGLYRFRVFRIPHNLAYEERERFIKRAHNTLSAVAQMGDHPHIQKVWVFENEEGDIIEGSEWSEAGTLRDVMRRHKGTLAIKKCLQYCYYIAIALKDAHNANLIHRAVKPENIIIINDIPKLTNFDLVYKVEDKRITVIDDPSKLTDDGYIAPEVIGGNDIDERTDYYSLGTTALELLTGEKVIKSARQLEAQGGFLNEQQLKKLYKIEVPEKVIDVINNIVISGRDKRIDDVDKIISAFSSSFEHSENLNVHVNNELEPGSQHGAYEIVSLLEYGAETQIYKAISLHQKEVAVKLFDKEVPRERIFNEEAAIKSVNSTYIVKCLDIGYWHEDRYFLVFDFIKGKSMRASIGNNEAVGLEYFRTIAMCLFEAVKALHERLDDNGRINPLLHNDIKPDNINFTEDKKAILIDFGIAGAPKIDTFQGTNGYIPPDSIVGADRKYSEDGDLFALGVTLWEWVFGQLPYHDLSPGNEASMPDDYKSDLPQKVIDWLKKAVSTNSKERFNNANEMKNALVDSLKKEEIIIEPGYSRETQYQQISKADSHMISGTKDANFKHNLFVDYLNSLSNVSAGNENATAETQIHNNYFQSLMVDNPLTGYIVLCLMQEGKNIILTGNAGDGKTTIAMEVIKTFKDLNEIKRLEPVENFPENNLSVIKDMSELSQTERVDIIKKGIENKEAKSLIVTNTGTFLNSFGDYNESLRTNKQSELLNALKAEKLAPICDGSFWVINMGRFNTINVAGDVFKRIMDLSYWSDCHNCNCCHDCFIYNNVRMVQEKIDIITERIMLVYRRLYEYDVRLTMRQMIGHLAFAVTAGETCSNVKNMSKIKKDEFMYNRQFFDLFFGDNGKHVLSEALQLMPIRCLLEVKFGSFLDPFFERKMWLKNQAISEELHVYPASYQNLLNDLCGKDPTSRKKMRRIRYFCDDTSDKKANKRYVSIFLKSPKLIDFKRIIDGYEMSRVEQNKLKQQILQVLQEFFTGIRLLEEGWNDNLFITLKRRAVNTGTQLVLAELQNQKFGLEVIEDYVIGTETNKQLYLAYFDKDFNDNYYPKLKLDLPFLDYVIRRYHGEIAEELSAYYADRLERFKVELLEHYSTKNPKEEKELVLVKLEPNRSFSKKKIIIENDKLEVL